MLRISHLAWALLAMAVLAAALGLVRQADQTAAPGTDVVRVAVVGLRAAEHDSTFGRLQLALRRTPVPAGPVLRLEYHEGGEDDLPRRRRAVEAAAASRPGVLVLPTGAALLVGAPLPERPPIVFSTFADPQIGGLIDSHRRPGRRITGVSLADDLHVKRLELLKDAFPGIARVAVLADRSWLDSWPPAALAAQAKAIVGLDLSVHAADTAAELAQALNSDAAATAEAWYVPPTLIAYLYGAQIIEHLQRVRLPSMHTTEEEVSQGATMAYVQDNGFAIAAMAALTQRIAAGEDAGSIPIERPRRYVLAVRVNGAPDWARVAPSLVRRADRLY